ncbi:MAG: ribose-5-phosphate isomerase RpiA [Halodesulfurarchaeum sp.]
MTKSEDRSAMKRNAGEAAAGLVDDGMVVGLGTGSTAGYAIDAIGEAVDSGLTVTGIPTSYQSRARALSVGIPLADLDEVDSVSLAIDGADQVVDGVLVKGGGAAHAREKIVATAAERFVVVVDPSKESDRLSHPIPVEVLPASRTTVAGSVRDLDGEPELRTATEKDGPVVTDNGNVVLDCRFEDGTDPAFLDRALDSIPGVVAHGLFVDMADEVLVGERDDVRRHRV